MTTGRQPGAPRMRSRWKRWRRILAFSLGALVLAAVVGALYEWHAVERNARRFPPPGQLVDVGDRRLHLLCLGRGSPVVVFEGSGFGNSASFSVARSSLAVHTRVCSYDRMGVGWSDPGPREISGGLLAEDLRRLLDAAQIREPIVVVASSVGGLTAELFARRHPERVAGLVFLDAANSDTIAYAMERVLASLAGTACSAATPVGAVGLLRLLDPWDLREERTEQAARSAAAYSADTRESLLPPILARVAGTPGPVPHLRETHQRLAQRSAHGIWKTVPGSDHLIASSQPQAVVDAVLEMIRIPDPRSRIPDPRSPFPLSASSRTEER